MNLPKPNKINAEKYVAGLSLFKQKTVKIKLSANESALGPSPRAIKEFNKVSKNLKRYPDSEGIFLRSVLAKKFKLDPKRIILGSGSDQIFELLCKSFLNKNDEVIVPEFSFIIYRIYSKICGAKIKYAKEKNFRISIDNILSKVTKNHHEMEIINIGNDNFLSDDEISEWNGYCENSEVEWVKNYGFHFMKKSEFNENKWWLGWTTQD